MLFHSLLGETQVQRLDLDALNDHSLRVSLVQLVTQAPQQLTRHSTPLSSLKPRQQDRMKASQLR
jgi:hypothetical protein